MSLLPKSKACPTKGRQKTFFLHQNRVSSCCRADSDPLNSEQGLDFYLQKWEHERQLLESGIEIPGCEDCWRYERVGQTSRRLASNDQNKIELFFSNLCNQMCSYCSPQFSSVWEENLKEQGPFTKISSSAQLNQQNLTKSADIDFWVDEIEQYIHSCEDQSVSLKILGGEPLMQQRNLQRILSMNSSKIRTLDIHTNLNPPTNKFLHWLLDNIEASKLQFYISIDASPEFNHWPRAKFEQAKFEQNFELLQTKQVPVIFSSVISVLSIFDLDNFLSWIRQQGNIKTNWITLRNPECLDPAHVPDVWRHEILKNIKDKNSSNIVEEILSSPQANNKVRLIEQHSYLSQYFQRNNLNPDQCSNRLFQEYWAWLTENYER
jgi:organic radical activating enzyme